MAVRCPACEHPELSVYYAGEGRYKCVKCDTYFDRAQYDRMLETAWDKVRTTPPEEYDLFDTAP